MSETDSLGAAQQRFARIASSLEGIGADARSLATWLREDRGVPALERMAVYAHAYFARIHGVLREDYGALHAALGDDAFHDLAKLYLMAHPPSHFSLRFAGERLPEFLAGPVTAVFRRRWPFAADLAALEWSLVDVFDAEDSPVLSRAELASVPPGDWGRLRFRLIPAHRLLRLDWPAHEVREAWLDGDRPLPRLEPRATPVLIHRREERVFHRAVSPLEARALGLVAEGRDFASLCAAIAEETGDGDCAARVVALLERWLAERLLAGFERG